MNMKTLARITMIAAIYTALCFVPVLSAIAFGQVQIRVAEALTILPLAWQPSIYGVTLGCFLSNLIGAATGLNPTGFLDAAVGTCATALAAYFTWKFRDRKIHGIPVLSVLMPVIFNFFFVGCELAVLFMPDNVLLGTLINGSYVAIGELIAVTVGWFMIKALKKTEIFNS